MPLLNSISSPPHSLEFVCPSGCRRQFRGERSRLQFSAAASFLHGVGLDDDFAWQCAGRAVVSRARVPKFSLALHLLARRTRNDTEGKNGTSRRSAPRTPRIVKLASTPRTPIFLTMEGVQRELDATVTFRNALTQH